ncbi:hypothetical protein [Edaphobacter modestus]|uniref:hypothetical protein n=1 Tax=Edaphobacter modestus TaxID=388466 RepID=UPI00102BB2EC|nr:hypothetical protein [Edaphobacter modestus]
MVEIAKVRNIALYCCDIFANFSNGGIERVFTAARNKVIYTFLDKAFLISSSQNIDRIVSTFRACKRTGKVLVIDIYTAWVLELMRP